MGFEFPFLDLLADGHTSFRWAPAQLLSGTHDVAVEGSQAYGTRVSRAAAWEPACDAYAAIPPLPASSSSAPLYRFRGTGASAGEFVELVMARLDAQDASARGRGSASPYPYPLALFRNVTNQPSFADGRTCGNMIRPFNTSLSEGPFAPAPVRGTVRAGRTFPFFDGETGQAGEVWEGVYGVQVATPFIENNYLECRSLQGYRGTGGSGDSHVE